MSDLKIDAISAGAIRKVLTSSKLSDAQKADFLKQNSTEIRSTLTTNNITKTEFAMIMKNRPLVRLRPIKNSFTKQGDKILLAKTLGVEPKEIDGYINNAVAAGDTEAVQDYVYRHGTKDQVAAVLEHELSDKKNVLKKLYRTMSDNSGGLADYFSRPIHRMSNKTLTKLYMSIDKSLRNAQEEGVITSDECNSTAKWALIRIYEIQNNSKLIKAHDAYKKIT